MTEPTDRNLLSRKESRSVRFLMVDPAVDCYLGDAHDLCETDEEKTRSGSSGGSQFTSGSGFLAVCTRSYSSASFCKYEEDDGKSGSTAKRENRGDCYLSDVSSCSELKLDLKESRCVSALRTDPAVDCYLGDALDLCESDRKDYQLIELPRQGKNSVSPTVMVYDLPPRPARPVLQCWEGPLVASCLSDTLETDRTSVATETDTVVQLLKVDTGSDDVTMETDTMVQLLKVDVGSDDVTMETETVVQLLKVEDALDDVTMETDTVVQMLKVDNGVTLAAPAFVLERERPRTDQLG
ncbi:uncharacterized protein LOC125300432 isoform X5 [Alosa alosa]|uniref:uncharacterized protein LOC125300432 isoform X5 n=1 Tax=Alosa alosa TaxID=278164 RepID=UPI0020154E5E|nr:uncharacterized protein LOC125300432 isoform X5 [Alosa alosa]